MYHKLLLFADIVAKYSLYALSAKSAIVTPI